MKLWIDMYAAPDPVPQAATQVRAAGTTGPALSSNASSGTHRPVVGSGSVMSALYGFKIEVEKPDFGDQQWRIVQDYSCGRWKELVAWTSGKWYEQRDHKQQPAMRLVDPTQSHSVCFLRDYAFGKGDCYFRTGAPGRWRIIPKDPPPDVQDRVWVGFAVKGNLDCGLGGEVALVYVVRVSDPREGFFFAMSTARLGILGGWSGGVALVVVTGIRGPKELDGHLQSGTDWTLSLAAKWDAVFKLANVPKVNELRRCAKLVQCVRDSTDSLVSLGKNALALSTIDWEEPGVNVYDIVGGGVNVGVYYYVSRCFPYDPVAAEQNASKKAPVPSPTKSPTPTPTPTPKPK